MFPLRHLLWFCTTCPVHCVAVLLPLVEDLIHRAPRAPHLSDPKDPSLDLSKGAQLPSANSKPFSQPASNRHVLANQGLNIHRKLNKVPASWNLYLSGTLKISVHGAGIKKHKLR